MSDSEPPSLPPSIPSSTAPSIPSLPPSIPSDDYDGQNTIEAPTTPRSISSLEKHTLPKSSSKKSTISPSNDTETILINQDQDNAQQVIEEEQQEIVQLNQVKELNFSKLRPHECW